MEGRRPGAPWLTNGTGGSNTSSLWSLLLMLFLELVLLVLLLLQKDVVVASAPCNPEWLQRGPDLAVGWGKSGSIIERARNSHAKRN